MTRRTENDQILSIDRLDNVRKELEGKIAKIDEKTEQKVPYHLFISTITIFVLIVGGIFSYLAYQNNSLTNKMDELNKNVAVTETKLDDGK